MKKILGWLLLIVILGGLLWIFSGGTLQLFTILGVTAVIVILVALVMVAMDWISE